MIFPARGASIFVHTASRALIPKQMVKPGQCRNRSQSVIYLTLGDAVSPKLDRETIDFADMAVALPTGLS